MTMCYVLILIGKIFFSDAGIHDRVVIQELLKKVAQANQLDTASQKDFKGKQHVRTVHIEITHPT